MRCLILLFLFLIACVEAGAQQPSPTPVEIREQVTITANRIETRIGETPASVAVIGAKEIETTAAPTLDDVLRQSVGFSIFRRTGSRIANPTTQGVSLRGVGSSGASRSVVLFDGVPLNDPFGGWVQWNRVVPIGVEIVEVRRGGSSSLYGASSLSGAVNIKPRRVVDQRVISADLFGGLQKTIAGSVFAGLVRSRWSADVVAGAFHTRGYKPVDESARGPVDSFAGVRSTSIASTLAREIGRSGSIFFRPSYFGEVRMNGTGLQTNRTLIRQGVLGGRNVFDVLRSLTIDWRIYGTSQEYDQAFSAVNATRSSETMTRLQRVPATSTGFSVTASFVTGDHVLLGGVEGKNVRGASDEIAYAAGVPTALVDGGGREIVYGIFVQDFVRIGERLVLSGIMRYDAWRHDLSFTATRPLATGSIGVTMFPDRGESALSPHVSALYRLSDNVSVYAAASKSFRSPTLNELYRGFRVGNVQTLANEYLEAERASNLEFGTRYSRERGSLRANIFWSRIEGPVSNITLSVTPNLITRQRRNVGSTLTRGLEIEGELRLGKFDVSAGYLFADPIVESFPANVAVEGMLIPQVSRHQFTFQAKYAAGKWLFSGQMRGSGEQYDDDLNQFRLEPFGQVDVYVSRRMSERIQIYTAVENVFNSRYSTGRTPIRTVSSPVNARVGIRFR